MRGCLAGLAATGLVGETNRAPSRELWQIAGPWLETGWLQARARGKPRGYAGDAELIERIYTGQLCDHPLGRAFDRFFQSQAAPQAVRNRIRQGAEAVRAGLLAAAGREFRVVSVGSGPAAEIREALPALTPDQRASLRVTLLDLDPEALALAGRLLDAAGLPAAQRICLRENLSRLPRRKASSADPLRGADLILCSGLFDYLPDVDAAEMLNAFWGRFRAGGRMLVFNFSPANPTRAYMEWVGNWYLIYRDAEAMAEIAARAGLPAASVRIRQDPSGASLCWDIAR
jgi:hypothetical protein